MCVTYLPLEFSARSTTVHDFFDTFRKRKLFYMVYSFKICLFILYALTNNILVYIKGEYVVITNHQTMNTGMVYTNETNSSQEIKRQRNLQKTGTFTKRPSTNEKHFRREN